MGLSTDRVMKYLGLMAAFQSVGIRVYTWLRKSEADSSPGGKEIVEEEIAALAPVISESITTGLQSAGIKLAAQVMFIPLE